MAFLKRITPSIILTAVATPAFAAPATFKEFLEGPVQNILNALIGLFIAIAVVMFVVGVVRFIATAGDQSSREKGKQLMIWGTIALFLMISVWGIVKIIHNTFFGP